MQRESERETEKMQMDWRDRPTVSLKISTHLFKYSGTATATTKNNFNIEYRLDINTNAVTLFCCLVYIEKL